MNRSFQFLGQGSVDQSMSGNQHQTIKIIGYGNYLEMRLGAGGDIMHMAFINDLQMLWLESVLQLGNDIGFNGHGGVLIQGANDNNTLA